MNFSFFCTFLVRDPDIIHKICKLVYIKNHCLQGEWDIFDIRHGTIIRISQKWMNGEERKKSDILVRQSGERAESYLLSLFRSIYFFLILPSFAISSIQWRLKPYGFLSFSIDKIKYWLIFYYVYIRLILCLSLEGTRKTGIGWHGWIKIGSVKAVCCFALCDQNICIPGFFFSFCVKNPSF